MSYKVKVSGLPLHVKISKLVPLFSNILSMRRRDFLLHLLPSIGPLRDVLLTLPTLPEAQLAVEKIDHFIYKDNFVTYILVATMYSDVQKPKPSKTSHINHRPPYDKGHNQVKSRSPPYRDASELDMQIEIIEKKRMILEEKRKLLEEQKKLEDVKKKRLSNQTLSANSTYDDVGDTSERSLLLPNKNLQRQLHRASESILKEMIAFVHMHSPLEEHSEHIKRLRTVLKQRLAVAVAADGQGAFRIPKMIQLYRAQYPVEEDEGLVLATLNDNEKMTTHDPKTVPVSSEETKPKTEHDGTKTAAVSSDVSENTKNNKAPEKAKVKFQVKRIHHRGPSSRLLKEMKFHINELAPLEIRKLLVEYLRFTFNQRIATLISGTKLFQKQEIVLLYRSHYSQKDDVKLIKQLIKDIDQGRVPNDVILQIQQQKDGSALGTRFKIGKTLQDTLPSCEEEFGKSGHSVTEKSKDSSVNLINAINTENEDENNSESITGEGSNLLNTENVNDKNKNNSLTNFVNDETERNRDIPLITENEGNVETNEEIKSAPTREVEPTVNNVDKVNDNSENTLLNNFVIGETEKVEDVSAKIKYVNNVEATDEKNIVSATNIMSDTMGSEIVNDQLKNNSISIVISDENEIADKEVHKFNIDSNCEHDDSNRNLRATGTTPNSSNMEVKDYNRGVKRKNDESENDSIKVLKPDEVAVITSVNTNVN